MTRCTFAAFMLIFTATGAFAAELGALRTINSFIDKALQRWEVPGLAVAVLRDGGLIYRRVAGLRDVEANFPVTPSTLFAVGSISKSFTVAGLAMLARAGKLDWDTPAVNYLPELVLSQLPNGCPARAVRLGHPVSTRHLITHRSGMHRHDALWYLHAYSRDGLLRRLRHLPRFAPAGTAFQYSNLMVMAAGRIAGKLSHGTWEKLTRDKVLAPLGMDRTRLGLAGFLAAPDRATGYYPAAEGRIKIPPRNTDAIGPAASVYADIDDMTRWLRFLISARDLTIARINIDVPASHPELGPQAYGMGLYLGDYRGNALARHPGVIDGYGAMLSFMPARNLGVIVMTNKSGGNPAPTALSHAIYDRLLGLEPKDWLGRFPSSKEIRESHRDSSKPTTAPKSPPPHPPSAYRGIYEHPAYGRMMVEPAGKTTLTGRFHRLSFVLDHAGGNRWRLRETHWPLREGLIFRFTAEAGGKIAFLATKLADGPTYRHNPGELIFERLKDLP